jgi:predicted nucleic acid-binding protein
VRVTFDSNILVYATAPVSGAKHAIAASLIAQGMSAGTASLMLQTLGEFSHVMIRKAGMPAAAVKVAVDAWRHTMLVHAADQADILEALDAVRQHRLHFWDAMLWAAAKRVGVRHILTEDMQDGRNLDGVHFVNPFNVANDALVERVLRP